MSQSLIVTGGAGFIGSQFVRIAIQNGYRVTVLDALTYAGHRANLKEVESHPNFKFEHCDIKDAAAVDSVLASAEPQGLIHFAAESHVDNSISGPKVFLETNIMGTYQLLDSCRNYQKKTSAKFRFLHVSTDEVFGALGTTGKFSETTAYAPNSPYSSSKAGSDHLVRAWHHTYGMDTIITNCSNNYGPRQFPEKLIPRITLNAIAGKPLPVYGRGENVRDWIHVEDHSRGVLLAFEKGAAGETYCLGGNSERKNIDVVRAICECLDRLKPQSNGKPYSDLIEFVSDRLGHDFRYAIDDSKAQRDLNFERKFASFETGLEETVQWYLSAGEWLTAISKRG